MRASPVVFAAVLGSAAFLDAVDVRFVTPLAIREVPSPVTVTAGDVDGDGRRDLIAGNGAGGIAVLLQDPADRTGWRRSSMTVGLSVFMVRAVDLDGDGHDEVLVADTATTAYLIRNVRGQLARPEPLEEARSSRWVTAGDWNNDGLLDVATANFGGATVSVYAGDGTGGLTFLKNYGIGEPHAVEGVDHDGDGDRDLMVGHGDQGIRAFEGKGDGSFVARNVLRGIPPCARYVFAADFDRDGKGDLALTCLRGTAQGVIANTVAATSNGDGSFRQTLDLLTSDIATAAVSDLNGDGHQDLAVVSAQSSILSVLPGSGDGGFRAEVPFGATGAGPAFLIASDLDADGRADVVSADAGSSTLTVFWGREGEHFLEAARVTRGGTGSAASIADFDGDAAPDLFLPGQAQGQVDVFLRPGSRSSSEASLTIATDVGYKYLTAVDLSGDAIPDLAGAGLGTDLVHAAIIDAAGKASSQVSLPAGDLPAAIAPGRVDGDGTVDLAAPCLGSSEVSLFLGRGAGSFAEVPRVLTVERPRLLVPGDVDSDGIADLVVAATGLLAVHRGAGGGSFAEPAVVFRGDPPRSFLDVVLGDVSGDALPDLVAAATGTKELLVLPGKRSLEPGEPLRVPLSSGPRSIALADLDSDGLTDITTYNVGQTVSIVFNRGAAGLEPAVYVPGAWPQALDHAVLDMNRDGSLDLVLFGARTTFVFEGVPPTVPPASLFRRGDADRNGKADLTDAIALLQHLFQGAASPCEDSSDADDDGRLSLTDALVIVRWLFQGGPQPAPPGPDGCGTDPTADELSACEGECG
ncbi:MAG: VCBS repeat-containing protein [Planctomycetes bacterium]|nr:VCBS repeat-containing protein [Planctomycetota bacterium]